MLNEPEIFFHIGAPKTASTFLQKEIFRWWPNMEYRNDLWFSYLVLMKNTKKYLISNETLMGRPWNRDFRAGFSWQDERETIIQALSRLFPRAQILICFRKHVDFVLSLYKQYLHEGGTTHLERFFDLEWDLGIIKQKDIQYMSFINLLEKCFEKKPFVFILEDLVSDLPGLIDKFEKLFREKKSDRNITVKAENVGVGHWQGKILRFLNVIDKKPETSLNPSGLIRLTNRYSTRYRFDPRSICQERLKRISRKPIDFRKEVKNRINEIYDEDWRALREYMNRNCSFR